MPAARGVDRPRHVTRGVLERYQRCLLHHRQANGRPLTGRSQAARLVAVRQWFRWLARTHRVLVNPAADLELPRLQRWQPRSAMTVTESESESVLGQSDLDTVDGLRDRAVLEVFYSTGIRAAELAALYRVDLDAPRGTLTLAVNVGKGGRSRVVPIAERATAWCEKYLLDARNLLAVHPTTDGCSSTTGDDPSHPRASPPWHGAIWMRPRSCRPAPAARSATPPRP